VRTLRTLPHILYFAAIAGLAGCVVPDGSESDGLVGEAAGMVEPLAIMREQQDRFLAVRALCTHMTCILNFNELNATLDCPCHGSSFELDGTVVTGPARQPLRVLPTRFDGTMLSVILGGA